MTLYTPRNRPVVTTPHNVAFTTPYLPEHRFITSLIILQLLKKRNTTKMPPKFIADTFLLARNST